MDLIILLTITAIAFFTGAYSEKRHYKSLREREARILGQPIFIDTFVGPAEDVQKVKLVSGSCVIAADQFKMMLSGLRSFFGGRISAYETILDRARREAILRMRDKARGADMIVRMRLETSEVGIGKYEIMAYGTAIYLNKNAAAPA